MKRRARTKIFGRRALGDRLARERAGKRRVVFTNGCFDVLHIGHIRSLEQARALGDLLVVGVNRDRRVRELKGAGRPLVKERQRAEMVAGLESVDYVVLFADDDASGLIRALRPDVVCKGSEYRGKALPEKQAVESVGGRLAFLRQIPGTRSTLLIERARR